MKMKAFVLYNKSSVLCDIYGVYFIHEGMAGFDHTSPIDSTLRRCLTQYHRPKMLEGGSTLIDRVEASMLIVDYFWIDPQVALRLIEPIYPTKSWFEVCERFTVSSDYFVSARSVTANEASCDYVQTPIIICPNCLNQESFITYGRPLVAFGLSMLLGQRSLDPPEIQETFNDTVLTSIICGECEFQGEPEQFSYEHNTKE